MKLATFVAEGHERFGLVITHPATGTEWVFDPEETETRLQRYAAIPTSPFAASRPRFLPSRPWPHELASFLALGDEGMSAARRLQDFLLRFLEGADQGLLVGAGYPISAVRLRAPIPRPRLYFGLVQNSPTFWRNDPKRTLLNIFPQGHARPQGGVSGPGDAVWVPPDSGGFSWNPEPGFIIGRGGKDIPVEQALEHVAGMTVVLDLSSRYYHQRFHDLPAPPKDWFAEATASWLGKMTDTFCPMGPYLTTLDEIGSIYNLQITTRQSGWQRDCSHTNSMLIGVERLIHWLSSFMTLYPGDVVHMGTMGVDGLPLMPEFTFGPDDYLEGEIERVGVLRAPVVQSGGEDWRSEDDPGRTIHPSAAVRDLILADHAEIEQPQEWSLDQTRHFWTTYGNCHNAEEIDGLVPSALPRILNGPARALGLSEQPLRLSPRATGLILCPEIAFVVKKVASRVREEDADDYILGYVAMASVKDLSFREPLREPVTPQEWNMPEVYGRWGDGYNRVSTSVMPLDSAAVPGRVMRLALDGVGEVMGNTDDYQLLAPRLLAFISSQITLFPGDIVTLGEIAARLKVPAGDRLPAETQLHVSIDGIGTVTCPIIDNRLL
ncbi:MAG: fumarylacetoacetate hydrolase family protein [Caldilineaceae bacterium]|nr:fumarylacetoacetate hydrolase family protein [Caldilineaceae bacterium]